MAASSKQQVTLTGTLLRFISCGLLSLTVGLTWRVTLAPQPIGIGSALVGILFLLSGFIVGGLLWYARDSHHRSRDPESVGDEQIVFSFVVFAMMPLAVLLVIGLIWVTALVAHLS